MWPQFPQQQAEVTPGPGQAPWSCLEWLSQDTMAQFEDCLKDLSVSAVMSVTSMVKSVTSAVMSVTSTGALSN